MDINDLSDLNIVKIDNLINDTTADNSHSVKFQEIYLQVIS